MPIGHYPFIDLAVHDGIREHYAAGDALVLFSPGFERIVWANGAGAALFGYDSIDALLDDGLARRSPALRQTVAAGNGLAAGGSRAFLLRTVSGFRAGLVKAALTMIALPDGEPALLLSATPDDAAKTTPFERAISGFDQTETAAAVLGDDGQPVAATARLVELRPDDDALEGLAARVSTHRRLVKQPIATANGPMPAALARLCDDPAMHLLFVVDPGTEAHLPAAPSPARTEAGADQGGPEARGTMAGAETPAPRFAGINAWSLDPARRATAATAEASLSDPSRADDKQVSHDATAAFGRNAAGDGTGDGPPVPSDFRFDRDGRPVRFVWRIDTAGRFTDVSPEFAEAVGPAAAALRGRTFADVARDFDIDSDGAIQALLHRRDTWSGRTVNWPIEASRLRVPVDLAALPTYDRNRDFSGFRGFGIVRVKDAFEDPQARGLTIGSDAAVSPSAPDDSEARQPASTPRTVVPVHRDTARPALSNGEQAAFREIAEKLSRAFVDEARLRPHADNDDGKLAGPLRGAVPSEAVQSAAEAKAKRARGSVRGTSADDGGRRGRNAREVQPVPGGEAAGEMMLPAAFALPRKSGHGLDEEIVDVLPLAVLVHSGERLFHANPEFLALTGHASLEALRQAGGIDRLFQGLQPDADPPVLGGPAMDGALMLSAAGGETIPVRARLRSVTWHGRTALMLSLVPTGRSVPTAAVADASATDAAAATDPDADSEEARQIARLRVEVDELRSILETATDGVVVLTGHGEIRSVNRSACALFNYDEAELSGQPFAKLFAHESQRPLLDYLAGLSKQGVASVLNDGREVIGRESSGGFIPLFMTIGRLSGSGGFCAVMRDITHWKRTEEELKAAKRVAETANLHKSAFLARISHEIRTPLNAIIGFSEMMTDERFGPIGSARYLEYAHDIGQSGRHVLDIVNDLLDISKIEAGEMEIEFAAVSINDAIGEAVSLLQPQANSQRVIIRTSLSSTLPEVIADRRSIKQIALNLLSNAIRFTPAGGQVVVSTVKEGDGSVVLRLRDTGVGMTADELEQAMKPFRQAAGTRRRGDGTGLGLPLTRAMTEANRARFDITSTPGEGTLVEIIFPPQQVLAD